ncbi:MAG: hypothetical protein V4482_04505 [Pseudomonadota bacterium]
MNPLATYTLQHFVSKAANSNAMPSKALFRKYLKIGVIVVPFAIWFVCSH